MNEPTYLQPSSPTASDTVVLCNQTSAQTTQLPTKTTNATATTEDGSCFNDVLSSAMRLADCLSIDDGVTVARQLIKDKIIQRVIGTAAADSLEDDCEQLPQQPKCTIKEVTEALSVMDFCEQIPDDACATEHLVAIRAIVAPRIHLKKRDDGYKLLWKINVHHAGASVMFLVLIQYLDNFSQFSQCRINKLLLYF